MVRLPGSFDHLWILVAFSQPRHRTEREGSQILGRLKSTVAQERNLRRSVGPNQSGKAWVARGR